MSYVEIFEELKDSRKEKMSLREELQRDREEWRREFEGKEKALIEKVEKTLVEKFESKEKALFEKVEKALVEKFEGKERALVQQLQKSRRQKQQSDKKVQEMLAAHQQELSVHKQETNELRAQLDRAMKAWKREVDELKKEIVARNEYLAWQQDNIDDIIQVLGSPSPDDEKIISRIKARNLLGRVQQSLAQSFGLADNRVSALTAFKQTFCNQSVAQGVELLHQYLAESRVPRAELLLECRSALVLLVDHQSSIQQAAKHFVDQEAADALNTLLDFIVPKAS